jgi:FG-GAP-like repeat/Bacterial Ig-like domain (group 3)
MRPRIFSAVGRCFLFIAASIPTLTASTQFLGAHSYDTGGVFGVGLVVADVNGDGKPDLVVANRSSGGGPDSIAVLLGNGDGTFQPAQNIPLGQQFSSPTGLAVADLNGDGKLDIVATDSYTYGLVGVFFGNGDGTFQPPQIYSTGGGYPSQVVIRDINADGKADLLVGQNSAPGFGADGTVAVLLGNGDGTFQPAQNYDAGGVASGPDGLGSISLAVVDVNGDGKLDVLTGIPGATSQGSVGEVGVLLGNGDGTFQSPQTYPSGGYGVTSIAAADVNVDGKQDAVVSNACEPDSETCSQGSISILIGNGDGTFQAANVSDSPGYWPCCVTIGDVTRDGKPDIVSAVRQYNGLIGAALLWGSNGDGTFQLLHIYSSDGDLATATALADVNGDGKLDLLVLNYSMNFLKSADSNAVLRLNHYFSPTDTTISATSSSSVYGQPVTLTAIVQSTGIDAPAGKVLFQQNGKGIGSAVISGGTAKLITSKLAVGSLLLTAMYLGDTFAAKSSSAAIHLRVSQAQVTMTLTSTPNPSIFKKSVEFTATFASTGGLPTGTVTFSNGATTLGTSKIIAGKAVFDTTTLPQGSNNVSATYAGSVDYSSASGSVVQVVN